MSAVEHEEVKGIISMRPGHNAGATCTCGWHSHSRTFEEHLKIVTPPFPDAPLNPHENAPWEAP